MKRISFVYLMTLACMTTHSSFAASGPGRIINGSVALTNDWPEIVRISMPIDATSWSTCTATLIGPRVLISAAHCVKPGKKASFTVGTKKYFATLTPSPWYRAGNTAVFDPKIDHDVALGLVDEPVTGVEFASIGGTLDVGKDVHIMGFGAYSSAGSNDGKLREGTTTVQSFKGSHVVLKKDGGSNSYFGDSGGPTFDLSAGRREVVAIHSRGLIQIREDYDLRTDIPLTREFIEGFAKVNLVDICGVNFGCNSLHH